MTVLFFSRLFYPHIGGVEKHVLEISRRLVKEGHSVIIVTENYSWKNVDTLEGIKIYRMNVGKNEFLKKFRIWWWLLNHRKLMEKADVIHCHDVFFWYMPFSPFFRGKKVFTTFHGYEGNLIPGFRAKLMHKLGEKMSNGNICIGRFLEKWYGTTPTFISYGAVDHIKAKDIVLRNKNEQINAVFIGRLEEETGILEYLRATKLLTDRKYKISLTVLGDGDLMKEAKRWAKKDEIDVKFLGFVKSTEKYIEAADIIFSSRYLGILEALKAKKYTFAVYNNVIKKDYLKQTPFAHFIAISKDPEGIAEKFEEMVKNKKQTLKKIEEGYNFAKEQTWDKMTNLYLDLWKGITSPQTKA